MELIFFSSHALLDHHSKSLSSLARPWRRSPLPMGLSLGNLLLSALLTCNGLAVLNEERFLAKIGWGYDTAQNHAGLKKQIITMLHAVRVLLTIPLIPLNVIIIALKIVLG